MSGRGSGRPAHQVYTQFVRARGEYPLAAKLWGEIPLTLGEAAERIAHLREGLEVSPELEEFKQVLKSGLRRWGLLTGAVSEAVEGLHLGVVEAGQQPMVLGGPSLSLNKSACIWSLAQMSGTAPLFYVADYDAAHAELCISRLPSPSARGLNISLPNWKSLEGRPIYTLGLPPEGWLQSTLERVEGNLRGLLKGVGGEAQGDAMANIRHAFTLVRQAYFSSAGLTEFHTRLLASLVCLEAGLGVPFYWFSLDEARPLFQRGFEAVVSEPTRTRFMEAANEASQLLEAHGYHPPIGVRPRDWTPWFLECRGEECGRNRLKPRYHRPHGSGEAWVSARCELCGEEYTYSFQASNPDLSDVVQWLTPRVDSRQIIVGSVIPVVAHVGGPGETSYYAEVIPGAEAAGLRFPLFFRYTRVHYNTPWGEAQSSKVAGRGLPSLQGKPLFSLLGRWVEARDGGDETGIWEAHWGIHDLVGQTLGALVERLETLRAMIDRRREELRDPQRRAQALKELKSLQEEARDIELYLSWCLGRHSPEKLGQEANWLWLDLASAAGVQDVVRAYLRVYNPHTPNGASFYLNT